MNRWIQRAWWKLRRKHISSGVVTVPPGETVIFAAPAALIRPTDRIVMRWECGGCNRNWRKTMNVEDAGQYGMHIACPICDPDEIHSRDVEPD